MPSVARTARVCGPEVAFQRYTHCRHVSTVASAPSSAGNHGPPSICTSTRSIPRCWAHATPATATSPAETMAFARGVSIRDSVLIGACFAHPRLTQYGSKASNVVSSMSASHLVAETKP